MSYSALGDDTTLENGQEHSPLLNSNGAGVVGATRTEKEGTANLTSCISNLMNTILGTGMLALPSAFASGGLIPGITTVFFCSLTAATGLYFLVRCASHESAGNRNCSFDSLSKLSFPKLAKIFDGAIFLKCYGVSISYLIIIGSLMPRVVTSFYPSAHEPPEILLDRRLWILAAMSILCPVAFLRKLDSLKYISYIALVSVANLLFVVIYKFFDTTGMPPRPPVKYVDLGPRFISSLPVQIFAFTCAQNIFAVFNELRDNSQKRLNLVIGSSIGSATIIYQILGTLGFLSFGAKVGSNIIEMYPHSMLVSICQVGIVILVLFSYPLQLHPCRASLDKVIRTQEKESTGDHGGEEIPVGWFVLETSLILFTTFVFALFIQNLETVLGFVGATGSTTISFILPSLFFISLFKNSTSPRDRFLRKIAVLLLSFGVLTMCVTLFLNVYHLFKTDEPHSLAVLGTLGGASSSKASIGLTGLKGGN